MLSTVQIFAFGAEGGEQFDLQINNESVASYTTTQQPQAFTYNTNEDVSADQIRVVFTNDEYDPANNVDANLIVDRIEIDGVVYQTEDPRRPKATRPGPETVLRSETGRAKPCTPMDTFSTAAPVRRMFL